MVPSIDMFPPLPEVLERTRFFLIVGGGFFCAALLVLKGVFGSDLSKPASKRLSVALFAAGSIVFVSGGMTVANALHLRVDPRSVVELEFTRIEEEQGPAVGAPRIISDPVQIQQAFASLSKAQLYYRRNHLSYRHGYVIRIRLRGEPDFSDRLLFAYSRSGSAAISVVVPSVSRTSGGALVDAGEYSATEFHDWLARTVDPLFSGTPETMNRQ